MLRSEAIKNLLVSRTHADLASMYNPNMEVQINVAQDGGERIDGDFKGRLWHGWTDGFSRWYPFRIPKDAKTEPVDNDIEINFDLSTHVEGIGMTGWDWKNRISRWVAFDFDAISGHSDKHDKKLTEGQLAQIQQIVSDIPWVTVRLSTSGKGLHLYVFLEPSFQTNNHVEHAAVARSILGLMASITGFDFHSKADVVGGNMWVYHRKMKGTNGLSLIKKGEVLLDIPTNWKEHLKVVTNQSRKVVPAFIEAAQSEDVKNLFDEITGQKTRVTLDEGHQKLIKYLHENKAHAWWDQDNHMLVTHTYFLKKAHQDLNLRGLFETNTPATDLNVQNCFLFPLRKSAWVVRRYTPGVVEASTWDQDGSGFTRCYLNREPDLKTAALSVGGIEHKTGGFVFRTAETAIKTASTLGINVELPEWARQRQAKLKSRSDGRILFEITHEGSDPANEMAGWLPEKKMWSRIFNVFSSNPLEPETGNYDDMVRHLITETHEDYGWILKSDNQWRVEPLVHIRTFLKSLGLKPSEVDNVLGSCIAKPWRIVCRPFEPEVLGDRDWNRGSPQIAFPPTISDTLTYPTWTKILSHCGKNLDQTIRSHDWCKIHGVLTGADYLKCWISSIFKEPSEPLPYLFFYGPQACGKSIFHEALELLITRGIERADNALISSSGFNAELENAIICVVEETDLRNNRIAYNRIKDWVTARQLPIHRKGMTPYSVRNVGHWIQASNEAQACPIFPGDSRITMIKVDSLKPEESIPKKQLIINLRKEAPDFLAAILGLDLPPSNDRLNIPVIETGDKLSAEKSNQSYLELFLEEKAHYVPGNTILFGDFYDRFMEWIDLDQIKKWSRIRVGRELPPQYPKGRSRHDNQVMIGNLSWVPKESNDPPMVLVGDKLEPKK